MIIGFSWGGWVTGGTAWKMSQRDAKDAMIAALAPICVDKFQNQADVEKNLTTLEKDQFLAASNLHRTGRLGDDAGSGRG